MTLRRNALVAAVICGVVFFGLVVVSPVDVPAELQGAKNSRYVTKVVNQLLHREHLSRRPLDDQISQRALKMFLEQLDPLKIFFLQSDIDEFSKYGDRIDDFVKSGDISIANTILERYLQRLDERTAEVDEYINMDHDYSLDEKLSTDTDALTYPRDVEEARDLWRRRIKYELLVRRSDDMDLAEAREKVARRYESLAKRRHQTDADELMEMFLSSVTSSYDPHTTYMSPSTHENFQINMKLNLEGIGAALQARGRLHGLHQDHSGRSGG